MALKTYKKAGEYRVISIQDDALDLSGTDEEKANAWERALETQNWPIKGGATPVVFTMKPLGSETMDLWRMVERGGVRLAGTDLGWSILGRMALTKVEGNDDLKPAWVDDDDFGRIASAGPFDALGSALSRSVQYELGAAVFHQETVTRGK